MPKIIAVVTFNQGEAFVLDAPPDLKYTKYGTDTIIGTDGVFYEFYQYERCSPGWMAFAGRKFDLPLTNGEVEHCYGQWWSGISKKAIEVLGINDTDKKVVSATAHDIEALKKCYVFIGYRGLSGQIEQLRKSYTGIVYNYWDYEKMVKGRKLSSSSLRKIKNNVMNSRRNKMLKFKRPAAMKNKCVALAGK